MKVLHVVAGSLASGAARGAYWLHRAELEIGIQSTLLTNAHDTFGDPSVVSSARTISQRLKGIIIPKLGKLPILFYPRRRPWIFNTGFEGTSLIKSPAYRDADLVHLHWINGFVRLRALKDIDKPLVWTMRDMWPLTGGCHYAVGCERYKSGCGKCPQLGSRHVRDLSWLVSLNKRASLPPHLRLVGISQWVSECARESRVLSGYPIETISNSIDTRQFAPVESVVARKNLGLPLDRRIVLVGARRVNEFYKGFDLFLTATKALNARDLHVVLFGEIAKREMAGSGISYSNLGFLSDTVALCNAYSAADVFVAPSRMEAFGKTLVEAMACGTPVVCFDATGPKDIVDHENTGFKAQPFDPLDLARGIQWVLSRDEEEQQRMRKDARKRAVTLFDSRVIAGQYEDLYRDMLG